MIDINNVHTLLISQLYILCEQVYSTPETSSPARNTHTVMSYFDNISVLGARNMSEAGASSFQRYYANIKSY